MLYVFIRSLFTFLRNPKLVLDCRLNQFHFIIQCGFSHPLTHMKGKPKHQHQDRYLLCTKNQPKEQVHIRQQVQTIDIVALVPTIDRDKQLKRLHARVFVHHLPTCHLSRPSSLNQCTSSFYVCLKKHAYFIIFQQKNSYCKIIHYQV